VSQINNVFLDSKSQLLLVMSLTPAATAAASSVEQSFAVPSGTPALRTTDRVLVMGPGSGNALALGGARVADATHIDVAFINPTAGSLTHAAGSFSFLIVRA